MGPCITAVLTRFKTDWAAKRQPGTIEAACDEAGYTTWRDRLLMPVATMQSLLVQIPYGNTACSHLPHLSGLQFSASAYCQAREVPSGCLRSPQCAVSNALQAIVSLSNTYPGRVHGKCLAAAMPYPLPVGSELLQDLGFIGLTFEGVGITQLLKKPAARH